MAVVEWRHMRHLVMFSVTAVIRIAERGWNIVMAGYQDND